MPSNAELVRGGNANILLFRMSEEKTDNILDDVEEEVQEIDPREDPNKKNDKPTLDETVQKLIGKAGNNMESTLIGQFGVIGLK